MTNEEKKEHVVRKPRQSRSQTRVDQILEAAKNIIAKKGCAGLTIVGIAEEAGITAGSMYQYFPNKSAIIFALGQFYLSKLQARIVGHFQKEPETRQEFWQMLLDLFDMYFDMQINDPVMKDVWMGTSVDKKMQDLDWNDTIQNAKFLFAISNSLYPADMHEHLHTFIMLILQYASCATETAIMSPEEDQEKIRQTAHIMITDLLKGLDLKAEMLEAAKV